MNLRQRKKAYIGIGNNPFRRFCWKWDDETIKGIIKLRGKCSNEYFKFNY